MKEDVLAIGDRILGRFTIKKPIAEGGMASIYLANDEVTGRAVAVKALYHYYADNDVIRARFLEEGRIQQMLRHPNIVHVMHVVEEPVLAFVMEYVDGPTLDDYLIQNGPLSEQELVDIIIPVMSAVGFAHSKGVIHRDIKPSNILVENRSGVVVPKVMDFGVAKVQSAKRDLTATGTTVGTLHYMSPEQIVGSKKIDGRADIYSIGVTIYKLMTGEVPFNAPTEFALMMAQVEAPPLPPRQLREDLSHELEEVILKAMAKKASGRFPSIKEFTQGLLRAKSSQGHGVVADTLTDRIPAQILQFAMEADEIATDRTGEMDLSSANRFAVKSDFDLDEQPTHELNRDRVRSKIQFPDVDNEATEEISPLALRRITEEAEAYNKAKDDPDSTIDVGETAPIPGLAERQGRSPDISAESMRATIEKMNDDAATLDDDNGRSQITKPSRPSAKLRDQSPSGARRSGVEVFDSKVNSRDVTAPKMSQSDYERAMHNVRNSSEMLPPRNSSGHRPLGSDGSDEKERVPVGGPPRQGPKMVLGKDYADTDDHTKLSISKKSLPPKPQAVAPERRPQHSPMPAPRPTAQPSAQHPQQPAPQQPAPQQSAPHQPAPQPRSADDIGELPVFQSDLPKLADLQPSSGADRRMIFVLIAAVIVIISTSLWILYLLFG